jgi:flagellar basal-body rod protein FlgF
MDGISWAASAMVAARTRLDIAADNLANASSNGFRRHTAIGFLTPTGAHIARLESPEQGALRQTGRAFDLALVGRGAFSVRDAAGDVTQTRNGAFTRDRSGNLRDDAGRALVGMHGALRVAAGATIESDGAVRRNGAVLDRVPLPLGTNVRTGFIESANVNAISEMVDVLTAQRSFESAQKVVAAIDATRQKASDDLARLK